MFHWGTEQLPDIPGYGCKGSSDSTALSPWGQWWPRNPLGFSILCWKVAAEGIGRGICLMQPWSCAKRCYGEQTSAKQHNTAAQRRRLAPFGFLPIHTAPTCETWMTKNQPQNIPLPLSLVKLHLQLQWRHHKRRNKPSIMFCRSFSSFLS